MQRAIDVQQRSVSIELAKIQHMRTYNIMAGQNGDLYYRLHEVADKLFNTGESVSPDEVADYRFTTHTFSEILNLCDLSLYTDEAL